MSGSEASSRRRSFLATASASLATATAGCIESFLRTSARDAPAQLSMTVSTPPADDDKGAMLVARQLTANLQTAGVDAVIEPEADLKLSQDVLLNRDFDVFVTRHPRIRDPDRLRTLLYSRYTEGSGWQNPFGYTNLDVDDALDEQRSQSGAERESTVGGLLEQVVRDQPFAVLAVPHYHSIASTNVAFEAGASTLQRSTDYLAVRPPDGQSTLTVALLDGSVTANRNPLAVEYLDRSAVLDAIYDSLGRRVDGRVVPWMASDWEWVDDDGDPRLEVDLRPDLTWHDDETVTGSDVAFSYRFLADTSLGRADEPVPAPRFRGRETLVSDVAVVDEASIRIQFRDCSREVARRALDVPILPKHVWKEKTSLERRFVTEALVWGNDQPVGSGPLAFDSAVDDESLTLVRNDDHFLHRDDLTGAVTRYQNRPAFDRVRFVVTPSSAAAVELVQAGDVDALGSPIDGAHDEAREAHRVSRSRDDTWDWYLLGFNARREHLSNPRFRRAVSRLVDRRHVVEEILDGEARASDVPPMPERFVPDDLTWRGQSAVGPFPGTDGAVDEDRVRDLFRNVGYRYDGGKLLVK